MRFLISIFGEGLLALAANKFRAFLTMLGIIIGVCAIVSVVSIGDSGKQRVLEEAAKVAQPTMMWVFPNWTFLQKLEEERKPIKFLEYRQFRQVAAKCRDYGVLTTRVTSRKRFRYQDRQVLARLSGVTREFFVPNHLELDVGRWFSPSDEEEHRRICILGSDLADRLFQGESPLGKVVRAGNQRYTVIGVLKKKGSSFFEYRSYDDRAYIPLATLVHRERPNRRIVWFMAIAKSVDLVPVLRQRIHQALIEVGMPKGFMKSRTFQEEAQGFENISLILKILVTGVSAISLFVGGLGIMNIMLVTVKERTREIGLRKAIGASSTWIRFQFFVESTLIGVVGGGFGAVLGSLIVFAVTRFFEFPTVISVPSVLVGMGFSALVGIVFGIYPAHQAACLDPAEALRYE